MWPLIRRSLTTNRKLRFSWKVTFRVSHISNFKLDFRNHCRVANGPLVNFASSLSTYFSSQFRRLYNKGRKQHTSLHQESSLIKAFATVHRPTLCNHEAWKSLTITKRYRFVFAEICLYFGRINVQMALAKLFRMHESQEYTQVPDPEQYISVSPFRTHNCFWSRFLHSPNAVNNNGHLRRSRKL